MLQLVIPIPYPDAIKTTSSLRQFHTYTKASGPLHAGAHLTLAHIHADQEKCTAEQTDTTKQAVISSLTAFTLLPQTQTHPGVNVRNQVRTHAGTKKS